MGLREAFDKIKYIIAGPSYVETTLEKPNTPSLDYRAADAETRGKTQRILDEIRLAEEAENARVKAQAEQVRLKKQALAEQEAAQAPRLTHVELTSDQTEDVIKNAGWLNNDQLDNYVKHLAQKKKK